VLGCLTVEAREKLKQVKERYEADCGVLRGVLVSLTVVRNGGGPVLIDRKSRNLSLSKISWLGLARRIFSGHG
jgi:hypothetical protein